TRDENVLDEIAKEIRKAGKCIDEWAEAGDSRIFMLKCTCASWDSPWNVWEPHEAVEAPPAIFQDGWGYFRVIAFDEVRTRDLIPYLQLLSSGEKKPDKMPLKETPLESNIEA